MLDGLLLVLGLHLAVAPRSLRAALELVALALLSVAAYVAVGFDWMYSTPWLSVFSTPAYDAFEVEGPSPWWSDVLAQALLASVASLIAVSPLRSRAAWWKSAFAAVCCVPIYASLGAWHWGGGWLKERGFHDFSGATLVHGVGGAIALGLFASLRGKAAIRETESSHPLLASCMFAGSAILTAQAWNAEGGLNVVAGLSSGLVGAVVAAFIARGRPTVATAGLGLLAGHAASAAGPDLFPLGVQAALGLAAGFAGQRWLARTASVELAIPLTSVSVGILATCAVGAVEGQSLGAQLLGLIACVGSALIVGALIGFALRAVERRPARGSANLPQ